MEHRARVVIIGGGASGTLTAVQLLRGAGRRPIEIVLVERAATIGRGAAYGTTSPTHLLNVPAASMSGLPDHDGDLVRWLRRRDGTWHDDSFAPRHLYGDYLVALLDSARAESPPSARLCPLTAEVTAVEQPDGPLVRLADGSSLIADQVILAVGNHLPAALPGGPGKAHYIADPWKPDGYTAIASGDHVAIAGTGLTAIDTILTLQENGHEGRITAISRRGLLPHAHQPHALHEPPDLSRLPETVLPTAQGLLRAVRSEVATAAAQGQGWQSVIDALRPVTPTLWQDLPVEEQRRFRRHLARIWDVHRHRLAPDVAAIVTGIEREGRLEVVRGRVIRVDDEHGRLRLAVEGPGHRALAADWLVNCTGPPSSLEHTGDPLLRQMQTDGLLSSHPSGVGAAATPDGGVLGGDGRRIGWLWAVGPLLKGVRWEATAIPEIRDQAATVAAQVMDRLCGPRAAPPMPGWAPAAE